MEDAVPVGVGLGVVEGVEVGVAVALGVGLAVLEGVGLMDADGVGVGLEVAEGRARALPYSKKGRGMIN